MGQELESFRSFLSSIVLKKMIMHEDIGFFLPLSLLMLMKIRLFPSCSHYDPYHQFPMPFNDYDVSLSLSLFYLIISGVSEL